MAISFAKMCDRSVREHYQTCVAREQSVAEAFVAFCGFDHAPKRSAAFVAYALEVQSAHLMPYAAPQELPERLGQRGRIGRPAPWPAPTHARRATELATNRSPTVHAPAPHARVYSREKTRQALRVGVGKRSQAWRTLPARRSKRVARGFRPDSARSSSNIAAPPESRKRRRRRHRPEARGVDLQPSRARQ